MEIVRVDPFDEAAVTAWHDTVHAADVLGREEWATPWTLAETLVAVQAAENDLARDQFIGLEGGRTVVAGEVRRSLVDNLTHAQIQVYTHPDHSRRGHGSAMLAHVEEVARAHGRTDSRRRGRVGVRRGPRGPWQRARGVPHRHGYRFGLGDVTGCSRSPSPTTSSRAWPRMLRDTTRRTRPLWVDAAPDDMVESLAALSPADGGGAHR